MLEKALKWTLKVLEKCLNLTVMRLKDEPNSRQFAGHTRFFIYKNRENKTHEGAKQDRTNYTRLTRQD